jgi:gamma-glutamyltranspeptidase/glutathione hydrolase
MIKEWPLGKAKGGILAFPIHISEEFMARLKEGDWTARMLFLHYGVGMHLLSNKWYVGIWGRRLVATVLQPGEEIPPSWEETVRWARRAVGCDVDGDVDGDDESRSPVTVEGTELAGEVVAENTCIL